MARYADKLAAALKLWAMVEEYSAVWNLVPCCFELPKVSTVA